MSMRDKVVKSLSTLEEQNAKMRRAVRRNYENGKWAAASDVERSRTRHNFQTNLQRRRELLTWLEEHHP